MMTVPTAGLRNARGAAAVSRIILLAGVALLIVVFAAWWFLKRPATAPVATPAPAATSAAPGTAVSTAPATVPDLSIDELYAAARKALAENRMATPPGDNALEYYLKILEREPDNAGAVDALRELFPFAVGSAQTEIDRDQFDEANRIIELLAKADPSNYSLTILRSKLDARRTQVEREALAAAQPQSPPPAQVAEPEAPAEAPAEPPAEPPAAVASTTAPSAPPAAVAPPIPQPVGETREAEAIAPLAPSYPPTAVRARQEGWVEVEFVVAADGSIRNARVLNAQPPRIFNDAAERAARNAKFRPKLVNGQPVDSVVRRRIEFKLGG